jgi:hypothetical protein
MKQPSSRWRVRWKSSTMKAPAFWYYATHVEALTAAAKLLRSRSELDVELRRVR